MRYTINNTYTAETKEQYDYFIMNARPRYEYKARIKRLRNLNSGIADS